MSRHPTADAAVLCLRWPSTRALLMALVCQLVCTAAILAEQPPLAEDQVMVSRDLPSREGVSRACTLDLALPKARGENPRPVIVVIHGGGWVEGDKSSFSTAQNRMPGNIIDFARLGFVAATINYRLSGEAPFPAALDDCQCAVRWLRAHADDYHLDPAHIGAYGNSAGGHLAMLLGLVDRPADPATRQPYAELSSRVQAVVSDSGPLDLLDQHQHNHLRTVIEKFLGGPPEEPRVAEYKRASPVNYLSEKIPPLLLIYGEVDSQVDVAITDRFVGALSAAGHKDVSYVRLANVDHCPHSLIRIAYLQRVVDDFFLRTLAPPSR